MPVTIYFWNSATASSEKLVYALRAADSEVIRLSELDDLLERCERKRPHLIITDASADEREASQRLIELANTPKLYSIPQVFIAKDAGKIVDVLKGSFQKVTPIDTPYDVESLIESASSLLGSKSKLLAVSLTEIESSTDPSQDASSESKERLVEEEVVQRKPRKVVADNTETIVRRIAGYLDPQNLENSYGGLTFALAREVSQFSDTHLFPAGMSVLPLQDFVSRQTSEDPEVGLHIRRLAFATSAIASSLGLSRERNSLLRASAALLHFKLREKANSLRRHDFYLDKSTTVQQEVSKSFLETAGFLRSNLNDTAIADRIECSAALLAGTETTSNSAVREDAEILLGVELALRSCWGRGYWDPSGVYRVLKAQRQGSAFISDKKVCFALAKLLGEAVTKHVTVGNIFVHHFDELDPSPEKTQPITSSSARSASSDISSSEMTPGSAIQALSLSDLTPGRTLARPVYAVDGRLVLAAQTVLTEELILDLWELAAKRALRDEIGVLTK